ncbi:MAG TPA: 16S rRNA (guanine(527)-N(7))-methyltransferase RsmG [Candidatus Limnocylindria bacterium]|nr:16S rRNA (guanine(527)-N(7))-methyltransferase RsmG [Candidatus Limnocylindria bacterium]
MSDAPPHARTARAARVELLRLLEADAPTLATTLPAGFADGVERYAALLLDANDRLNLTRVVEADGVARLHLLDALSALPIVDALHPRRAVDLGSGGGVPGIVLALARPDVAWLLVDSVAKKVAALAEMIEALGMAGRVEARAERIETLGRDPGWRETADLVTARACAPLPVLVEYALPLLRVGGRLVAWKGPIGEDELGAGGRAADLLGGEVSDVRATGIGALGDHHLVLVDKRRATPERFPRRPGEPSRRPLG